jgi:hypothetical protein
MVVWLSLVFVEGLGSGIDIIVDREYEGNYIAKQSGVQVILSRKRLNIWTNGKDNLSLCSTAHPIDK